MPHNQKAKVLSVKMQNVYNSGGTCNFVSTNFFGASFIRKNYTQFNRYLLIHDFKYLHADTHIAAT